MHMILQISHEGVFSFVIDIVYCIGADFSDMTDMTDECIGLSYIYIIIIIFY